MTPLGKGKKIKGDNCCRTQNISTELKLQEQRKWVDHDSYLGRSSSYSSKEIAGSYTYVFAMWVKGEPALKDSGVLVHVAP